MNLPAEDIARIDVADIAISLPWDHPAPFVHLWQVTEQQIDHYNHVNNVEYVSMLETVAWRHSNALGLSIEQYRELDRGMAISRHEIDYLAAGLLGEQIACATWVQHCDNKLRLSRAFQFIRIADKTTLLRAKTDFVCIALSSGRPKKMPALYAETYGAVQLQG